MFKKALAVCSVIGGSALAIAQDAAATTLDLTDYLENIKSETETQIDELLPILGDIAVIGIVVFLAMWAFRMVKRFLAGR